LPQLHNFHINITKFQMKMHDVEIRAAYILTSYVSSSCQMTNHTKMLWV